MNTKGLVFVQGPAFYSSTARVFKDAGYDIVDNIKNADIVVLTGGEDINPAIYGEERGRNTYYSEKRDSVDLATMEEALAGGKFMVGICRGAQLLNCRPNGGKLWQDVNGHTGGHHECRDHITNELKTVISVHHQQMIPTKDAILVATTSEPVSSVRRSPDKLEVKVENNEYGDDVEVLFYPKTRSLCFQGHPEFGHPPSTAYFLELMDRYYHAGQ